MHVCMRVYMYVCMNVSSLNNRCSPRILYLVHKSCQSAYSWAGESNGGTPDIQGWVGRAEWGSAAENCVRGAHTCEVQRVSPTPTCKRVWGNMRVRHPGWSHGFAAESKSSALNDILFVTQVPSRDTSAVCACCAHEDGVCGVHGPVFPHGKAQATVDG